MTSLVVDLEEGVAIEVGVIGREGISGLPALLGSEAPKHQSFMQIEGRGTQIGIKTCREHLQSSPTFRDLTLHFSQTLQNQVSQTVVCNVRHDVTERLARWLLGGA